jgi:hypothetical protein
MGGWLSRYLFLFIIYILYLQIELFFIFLVAQFFVQFD